MDDQMEEEKGLIEWTDMSMTMNGLFHRRTNGQTSIDEWINVRQLEK